MPAKVAGLGRVFSSESGPYPVSAPLARIAVDDAAPVVVPLFVQVQAQVLEVGVLLDEVLLFAIEPPELVLVAGNLFKG